MTSSFERHGLDHLSASSVNLFAAEPALWVLEKLLGKKGKVGAAAHRGNAAERGIAAGLVDGLVDEECITLANEEYRKLTALSADPNRDKEGEAVPKIVVQGLAALRLYGKPSATQRRIEWHPEELAIPFIGYVDLDFGNIVVDLKTQLRLSSQIARNHARQVSIYGMAGLGNSDLRLAYVTPQKSAVYQLEYYREHANSALRIAETIGRFLNMSSDPQELAGILIPDVDSYYFSDPSTRQIAFEQWGV